MSVTGLRAMVIIYRHRPLIQQHSSSLFVGMSPPIQVGSSAYSMPIVS